MNVKEGHPGGVFHWFFDTDQGTHQRAQLLMLLIGSSRSLARTGEECLKRQSAFDDVLGPEILFLFFDPDVSPQKMSEDGVALRNRFRENARATFAFAGLGEAYPLPTNLIEVGKGKFRSEAPGQSYFAKIAGQAADCNARVVPFFQQTFNLAPQQNYLIIAHRTQRAVQTFELGETPSLVAEELLILARALRPIARHSRGQVDLDAINTVTIAQVNRGAIRFAARVLWTKVSPYIRSLPH